MKILWDFIPADPSVYCVGVSVLSPELEEDKDTLDSVPPVTDAPRVLSSYGVFNKMSD